MLRRSSAAVATSREGHHLPRPWPLRNSVVNYVFLKPMWLAQLNAVLWAKPFMIPAPAPMIWSLAHLRQRFVAHDANAVCALDPNHTTAPQDMTKVQLPHHHGDFHFA